MDNGHLTLRGELEKQEIDDQISDNNRKFILQEVMNCPATAQFLRFAGCLRVVSFKLK